ncbi:molybdopterin molybdotransferase MoeA [Rhodoblastus acidophilus]|uniref:Molybdopterin molybdenumtransferase n=1 Tax=Candidatus Rhodoblastus alkanivorans TaxID=2954117 RepID=A0ABS9Z6P7_9HYPH|nr:gephyrin-like molybdotransferase Glp [Candidatus Rhodoblastus alkanivorans]MCI4679548.1 molybdopterin molybdotransferase MoeA [Candidatus Rhodoblastus alkanivorans]MCI4683299.1 molybdopterin molybdotransferase MoeA [Candidatus Rhodoblastus alkanivorans]MDI4640612.1 molybdopterin molybdotransferase MoeA [Rhodoblastus acidophilus]
MSEKKPPLSVEEALAAILAGVAPLEIEDTPLALCFGRTLARDVAARRTQPPKPLSAMDGYALRAEDAAKGPLKVIGESAAGRGFERRCDPGEAVRIFTGAPIPQGADSVLIQEEAERAGDHVVARAPVRQGRNIRAAGIDFRDGEIILRAGRRLSPADVALAASADHAHLPLTRKPRVAVLSTGDELTPPGEERGPDQIVASNAFAVLGLVAAAGGEAIDLGIATDHLDDIEAAIGRARVQAADILVTIGGASVGDRDLVRGALAREGMDLQFWKVNMKPGKPLIHGLIGPMRVLGLPGNPVSAAVCGELFLRPLIRALCGDSLAGADRSEPALAGAALPAGGPRREYVRATLAQNADGRFVATPQPDQDSSLNSVLAHSQALIVRAEHAPPCAAGELLRILRLGA